MKSDTNTSGNDNRPDRAWLALGLFGLIAPVFTFVLAVSSLSDRSKIFILVILAGAYAAICFWSFRKGVTRAAPATFPDEPTALEDSLKAIGEASEFFGSSLKPADMFRLVSSRVGHVFPFETSALYIATEDEEALEVAQSDGADCADLMNIRVPFDRGVAAMAWVSREIEIDAGLKLDRVALPESAVVESRSAAAIPLLHDGHPFAIMVLYTKEVLTNDEQTISTLHAIGERVAPLFLSSISFERSVSNALTDSVTQLPNERAFYMVLENQLAESQRFRAERPLTILTVDIKNFADANQMLGYSVGDRILAFSADLLSSQLRKMDFLARALSDEFLIILPTASDKFASEIIERIKDRFAAAVFPISESDEMKIWLNFGWATFWQDGETAEQLLQTARIRKQQSKAEESGKVVWFPKEYVN